MYFRAPRLFRQKKKDNNGNKIKIKYIIIKVISSRPMSRPCLSASHFISEDP